jgi:hypothetical protein
MAAAEYEPRKLMLAGLREAVEAADLVGHWDYDVAADRLFADAPVAALFGVDPEQAESGAPLAVFAAGIHPDDRERIVRLIAEHAREGSSYLAEYRVSGAYAVTRWVLARGSFRRDAAGRPLRGSGIIVDVSRSRLGEDAFVTAPLSSMADPLERAANAFLAGRRALDTVDDQPMLQQFADILLFEVGRVLAARDQAARRRRMI